MTLVALAIGMALAAALPGAERATPENCPDVLVNPQYDISAVIKGCDSLVSSRDIKGEALAEAYFHRGQAYGAKGDHAAARADFDHVIQLQPGNAQAFNNRGTELVLAGDIPMAEADFKQAIALLPAFAEAYNNLGKSYELERKFELSVASYTKAYDLFRAANADTRKIYSALLGRGAAYQGIRNFELAFEDYDQAVALEPNISNAYNDRGGAYFTLKAFDRAVVDFELAMALGDMDKAPLNRAIALREAGRVDAAVDAFDKILASQPDNLAALTGRCLARLRPSGSPESALADCEKAVRLSPNNIDALLDLGAVYFRLNRFDEAWDVANLVLGKRPGFGRAVFLRGVVRVRKGDAKGGQADINAAVAINRDIPTNARSIGLYP